MLERQREEGEAEGGWLEASLSDVVKTLFEKKMASKGDMEKLSVSSETVESTGCSC